MRLAWILVIAVVAATVPLALAGLRTETDAQNAGLKSVGTKEADLMRRRVETFGGDHDLVLLFQALPRGSGEVTPEQDEWLAELLERLRGEPGVLEAARVPLGEVGARVLRVAARALPASPDSAASSGGFGPAVERVLTLARDGLPATMTLHATGQPLGELVVGSAVQAEQRAMVPWIALGLAGLLFAVYRRVGLVAAAMAPALVGIAWTSGVFALLGHRLDPISVLLQPVVLTVGVAGGVHLIEAYLALRTVGDGTRGERSEAGAAAVTAVRRLLQPMTLATFTTVVGFLALTRQAIPSIADFGAFAALGVSVTLLLDLLLVPALLTLLAARIDRGELELRRQRWRITSERLARVVVGRASSIRWSAALIVVLAAWPLGRMTVDTDPLRVLPAGHAFRQDTERVTSELGGSEAFDLLVPSESRLADLGRLPLLGAMLLEQPGIVPGRGQVRRAAGGDLLLSSLLEPSGTGARTRLFDQVDRRTRLLGAPEALVTGTAVQVARDSQYLVRGQVRGLAFTTIVLTAVFAAVFRSLFIGVLAMVPNLLPCLVVNGALAAAGRPVSVATAMISTVMLGLVVDDTIHFLHQLRCARLEGAAPESAVALALERSGRAITITSLVLAGGFGLGVLGELTTTHEFSLLAASTILLALVADLLLLPALVFVRHPRREVPSRA